MKNKAKGKAMKSILSIFLFLFISSSAVFSQGTAGNSASYESLQIVDMPTAGVLKSKTYSLYCSAFSRGGISIRFNAGIFENFNIGASYSSTGIIGESELYMQALPGFHLKYRVFNEKLHFPAIAIGFNTQGSGYQFDNERFQVMSPGFYLAVSKNYIWDLGELALHSGINYSLEPVPAQRKVNFYAGIEQSIGSSFAVNLEYNANLDEADYEYMETKGLVNAAFKLSISRGITIELHLKDILEHRRSDNLERIFSIDIVKQF